jgi:hypothetical protein
VVESCRVYFRDRAGIEHAAYVSAVDRYHAFGLAMHEMRRCAWCHPDYREVQRLTIERLDRPKKGAVPRERIAVTRDEFETWLNDATKPRDKLREYLLMLLGRIEPDRDFKRGIKAR